MQLITSIPLINQLVRSYYMEGLSVGLVPTMGALHEGHLALVRQALAENDRVVVSIFVNPIQFNNAQDLAKYPRTLSQDQVLLEQVGCHVLFCPTEVDMYPAQPRIGMQFEGLDDVLEGAFRPGHFSGVGVVVSKLFHAAMPHRAYFGQKDFQQCLIIRQLVKDLSFPITLRFCPTVRESSGLALSSRNTRLSALARNTQAPLLYQALQLVAQQLAQGHTAALATAQAHQLLAQEPAIQVEYLSVVDTLTLKPVLGGVANPKEVIVCIAAYLEGVRLIDNLWEL